ncbi:Amine oxidase flavin-containing [Hondaea fermentalgiana]|uniref:monoamine oxidase n=1 Tax=Hondaea fermentalgiana TaxID=2315210 RepID=A0A2R5GZZ3_9STRA|nr:Amine oxidase flavin-containing [Hondaea fermentalgiana]|eukprot:GBG34353.1 Amine oxidase flavin-containing [Hondaea fermentalgiana]
MEGETHVDALVVGGGASGLAAALHLQDQGCSRVVLVEARDATGGRAGAGNLQTQWRDDADAGSGGDAEDQAAAAAAQNSLGAGYVDATQRRVLRMAARVGLGVKAVNNSGRHLVEAVPGARRRLVDDIPRGQSLGTLLDTARLVNRAEITSLDIRNLEAPWEDETLRALDAFTVEDFVQATARDEEARSLFRLALLPVFGAETHELSLAWLLYYARAGGSLSRLLAVKDGAQEYKLAHAGGFGELARRMAALLRPDSVRLGNSVVGIEKLAETGDLRVKLGQGEVIIAKHVVLAIQPSLYKDIQFSPALPSDKLALCETMNRVQGCYVKVRRETLRKDHMEGRLHFAGAETATCWTGYVDGAIQAGERAAAAVSARGFAGGIMGIITYMRRKSQARQAKRMSVRAGMDLRGVLTEEETLQAQEEAPAGTATTSEVDASRRAASRRVSKNFIKTITYTDFLNHSTRENL